MLDAIDKGLEPFKKQFYREIITENIVRLTEIKIKRISRYDSSKADETKQKFEEELAQVENDRLFEIYNGHPSVHNDGGGGFPSLEEIWDMLLTGGKRIYGIAVDDAHHFQGEFSADRANPGRGWISVRARSLDAAEIMQQLEAGQFYASTGVDLADVVTEEDRLEIHIAPREGFRYTTTFIGSGGRVLSVSLDNPAVYTLQGRERYVRAKVTDSRGEAAWVQPVFVITP